MGVNEHEAQTRSERLIRAMDRLSENIEKMAAMQDAKLQTSFHVSGGIEPFQPGGIDVMQHDWWRKGS